MSSMYFSIYNIEIYKGVYTCHSFALLLIMILHSTVMTRIYWDSGTTANSCFISENNKSVTNPIVDNSGLYNTFIDLWLYYIYTLMSYYMYSVNF